MHEDLRANVDRKVQEAHRAYEQMEKALRSSERTQMSAALEAAGAIVDSRWQESFWPAVGDFLAKVRSVPWIIEACFGYDYHSPQMKAWLDSLPADERQRRKGFSSQFADDQKAFRQHHLTNERDVTVHRLGFPDVKVGVVGPFGQVHTATPTTHIPTVESRPLEANMGEDPALQWAATQPPRPVRTPRPDQFTVGAGGKPLFAECRAYLELAQQLAEKARGISTNVHGTGHLSTPPAS
jgi:hypothetical protein